MLTAKQILAGNIVTLSEKRMKEFNIKMEPAQMGIDLHLVSVSKMVGSGRIPSDNAKTADGKKVKAVIAKCEPVEPEVDPLIGRIWKLEPGEYEIGFAEGCHIPLNGAAIIIHRSSVRRNGTVIYSPLWDPDFHTEEMGTFMHVNQPIVIDEAARVAQIIVFDSKEEAEAYNGQYQGQGVLNGNH